MHSDYEIVVGLEVHAQLLTKTKLFCGDSTIFGRDANTQVSIISLGHPGTLPKLNKEAITLAVKLGLACNCTIEQHNYFARKNYFYPDLPKGYQVTQHTTPICKNGFIEITAGGNTRKIRLNRIHIEEDAGKSMHPEQFDYSDIDYNRAGTPLLEIVTEPDIRSAEEAFAFVSYLRKLVRYLKVCDGNMEEGSFRCDVNISVRKKEVEKLGTRVEIKNLNSLRFIKKAIEFESARLISLHKAGKSILQETRGFDEKDFSTYAIRTKEDEDDYRYFPEPDLPPFYIDDRSVEMIREQIPPLQNQIKNKLSNEFRLSAYDAEQIAEDSELSALFFEISKLTSNYKSVANWMIGPVRNHLITNDISLDKLNLNASSIAHIIELIDEGKINYGIAVQQIFNAMVSNPGLDIHDYIQHHGLSSDSSSTATEEWIDAALQKHAGKIAEYKKGKKGLLSVFVGEVMKLSKGRADARIVTDKITEKLKHS